jgi:Cu/Ag efflux pump CusA
MRKRSIVECCGVCRLTTSTLLTILVLPALYQWIEQRREVSTTSQRENYGQ